MLEDFTIKNFRGIKELTLPALKRVNLFVGKNGVGKTSVLEALRLYLRAGVPAEVWHLVQSRGETGLGASRYALFSTLFNTTEDGTGRLTLGPKGLPLTLDLRKNPDVSEHMLPPPSDDQLFELVVQPSGPAPAYRVPIERPNSLTSDASIQEPPTPSDRLVFGGVIYLNSSARAFVDPGPLWDIAVTDWNQHIVVDTLRVLFPTIEGVALVAEGAHRTPVVKRSGSKPAPLASLGEGAERAFALGVALANRPTTILIDEIENGIHYSAQAQIWKVLLNAAADGIQVFATTHSRDTVYALAEASHADDHIVYRLSNDAGLVRAHLFDNKRLDYVVADELEIR